MDTAALKGLNESLRQLATVLKRCRAAEQILDGYLRLNSSSDGIAMAMSELQTAADELAKHSRHYAKAVGDLSSSVNTTSTPAPEEIQQ
jgi:hypothetical protein